jgi:formate dehydrogenase maturation protein FdhE
MENKFPVEKEVLDKVYRSLEKETDGMLAVLIHLNLMHIGTTDKKISKYLRDEYEKVQVRFDLLMSVQESLSKVRWFVAEVVEVVEVVEVAPVVELVCPNCGGIGEIHEGYSYMVCSCKKLKGGE